MIEEFPETEFTLLEENRRIAIEEMPMSPRKVAKAALANGWEVSTWLSVGIQSPTLYMTASEGKNQHNAGDVRFEGYFAFLYVVEARDPETRAIGFRAHFTGKHFGSGKASSAGGFDHAFVADPIGLPTLMEYTYKPITQLRGKYETDASFRSREREAKAMTDRMAQEHNDRTYYLNRFPMLTSTGDLLAWLVEWGTFTTNREIAL